MLIERISDLAGHFSDVTVLWYSDITLEEETRVKWSVYVNYFKPTVFQFLLLVWFLFEQQHSFWFSILSFGAFLHVGKYRSCSWSLRGSKNAYSFQAIYRCLLTMSTVSTVVHLSQFWAFSDYHSGLAKLGGINYHIIIIYIKILA